MIVTSTSGWVNNFVLIRIIMADLWTIHITLTAFVVMCGATADDIVSMSSKLHGELTLPCSIEDITDTTVSWSFLLPDGVEKNVAMGLQNLDPTFEILNPTSNERNLKLTYLTEDRVGIYTCKSESKFGKNTVEAKYNVSITHEVSNNDDRPATMIVNTQIGKTEELTCIVKDHSPDIDTVSWYKETENSEIKLSENENSLINSVTVKHSDDKWSLIVNITSASSEGLYLCKVRKTEYALYDIKVEGSKEPPYIVKKPMYTKNADLPCVFTEQDRPIDFNRIRWRTNDNQTITRYTVDKRKYKLEITPSATILTVKTVYPSRSDGIYKVFLGNKPLKNCMFKVEVQKMPSVDKTHSSQNQTLKEGETANLTCVITGRPEPNITWGRKRRIKNPELEKLEVEGPTLIIPNISRYAAEIYVCIGSNVIDGSRHAARWSIDFNVNFGPEIELFEPEVSIEDNQDVKLHCLVQAGTRPKTHWYNADTGEKIPSSFRYHPEDLKELEGYSAYMMTLSLLVKQSVGHVFNVGHTCRAEVDGKVAEQTIIVRDNRSNGDQDSDIDIVPYNESTIR